MGFALALQIAKAREKKLRPGGGKKNKANKLWAAWCKLALSRGEGIP
jgi:hypothetical protein